MEFRIIDSPAPMRAGVTYEAEVTKIVQGPEDLVPIVYLRIHNRGARQNYTPDDYRWVAERRVTGKILEHSPTGPDTVEVTDGRKSAVLRYTPEQDQLYYNGQIMIAITQAERDEYLGVIAQVLRQGWSEPG